MITERDIAIELEELEAMPNSVPTHVGERFLRFMGANEYYRLLAGEELTNGSSHKDCKTDSVGFCFLRVGDEWWNGMGGNPVHDAYEFLSGIVSDFVAVEFVNANTSLKDSYGVYADPLGDWDDLIAVDEYSAVKYDKYSMVPLKAHMWVECWKHDDEVVIEF